MILMAVDMRVCHGIEPGVVGSDGHADVGVGFQEDALGKYGSAEFLEVGDKALVVTVEAKLEVNHGNWEVIIFAGMDDEVCR